MKKHIIFLLTLLIILALCSCKNKEYVQNEYIKVKLNEVCNLDFHNDLINEYMNDEASYFVAIKYAEGKENKYDSKPIIISWKSEIKKECDVTYKVVISNKEYDEKKEFITKNNHIDFYNPYLNTTYDYELTCMIDGSDSLKISSSFTIETKKIRTIMIDGIMNCRDLGGYETIDGGMVKQGLIYRTARFNDRENGAYKELITEKGLEQFNDLRLKTEIDLRDVDESSFRKDNHSYVENYYLCPTQFNGNGTLFNKEFVTSVFDILADENNYPLFFHCAIGTDRTGLIAFLIEAILGVETTDIYYDYMLSNFSNIGSARSISSIENYIWVIDYDSDLTLKEQTIDFLVNNIGVSQEKIENIQRILLK